MDTRPLGKLLVLVSVLLVVWALFGALGFGRSSRERLTAEPPATRSFHGYMKALRATSDGTYAEIDEVEFLSGDEAYETADADTPCSRENAAECVPSLNNDFYIRNASPELHTFIIDEGADIVTQVTAGSPVARQIGLGSLVTDYSNPELLLDRLPFRFVSAGDLVISIEQQYVP